MSTILHHWVLSDCLGGRVSLRTRRFHQNRLCQWRARSRSSLATVLISLDLDDRHEVLLQFRMGEQDLSATADRHLAGQYEEIGQSTCTHSLDVFIAPCTDPLPGYSFITEKSEWWMRRNSVKWNTIESAAVIRRLYRWSRWATSSGRIVQQRRFWCLHQICAWATSINSGYSQSFP